jgi:hypothetical protein
MLKRNSHLVAMPTQHRERMAVDSLKANRVGCACFAVKDSRARSPSRRRIAQGGTVKGYSSGSTQYLFGSADCLVEGDASNNANDALGDIDRNVGMGLTTRVASRIGVWHNTEAFQCLSVLSLTPMVRCPGVFTSTDMG